MAPPCIISDVVVMRAIVLHMTRYVPAVTNLWGFEYEFNNPKQAFSREMADYIDI